MLGLLNINKAEGVTSRSVVDHIQRLVKPAKAGHAGTLDPLASGVLVVCIGQATRLVAYIQQLPKQYRASFLLGYRSDTEDVQGEVTKVHDAAPVPREAIEQAIPRFLGEIQQRPPAYSAVKVAGKRAYALARQGDPPDLSARPVHISEIRVIGYEYPELKLEIHCGSGTYVRALGRDLAEAVGTHAVMNGLVRTAIGGFRIQDAVDVQSLTPETLAAHVLPPVRAMEGRAVIRLRSDQLRRISQGQFLDAPRHGFDAPIAAVDDEGTLVAVLKPHGTDQLRPDVVLKSGPQT